MAGSKQSFSADFRSNSPNKKLPGRMYLCQSLQCSGMAFLTDLQYRFFKSTVPGQNYQPLPYE